MAPIACAAGVVFALACPAFGDDACSDACGTTEETAERRVDNLPASPSLRDTVFFEAPQSGPPAVPLAVERDPDMVRWGMVVTGLGAATLLFGLLVVPGARKSGDAQGWHAVGALVGAGAATMAVGIPLWIYGASDRETGDVGMVGGTIRF